MAGRIRDEDVALVRERASIDDVVREYVTLKTAGGGSLKGLCPFHDEKSPSFHVTPSRGMWYCFGCGEGGDVINFVQRMDHLSFAETIEKLAEKTGVQLRYVDGGAFAMPGGDALRSWIDEMSNEQYQSLFGLAPTEVRQRFLENAPEAVHQFFSDMDDHQMADLVKDLGGHDLESLADAFVACDKEGDRPSVVFAYTIKGWGLPIAGNPRNHSALLTPEQIDDFRRAVKLTEEDEWDRFDAGSAEGIVCNEANSATTVVLMSSRRASRGAFSTMTNASRTSAMARRSTAS